MALAVSDAQTFHQDYVDYIVRPGWGLYVTGISGAVLVISSLVLLVISTSPQPAEEITAA